MTLTALKRAVTLEEEIQSAYANYHAAYKRGDLETARTFWEMFVKLHGRRSKRVIEQMERARGLS